MHGDDARRELDRLLRGPVLLERWPDGLTTDDVLAALSELGRLSLAAPTEELERYRCSLVLHDGAGRCSGSGLTLTAAAVRCLLEAEEGIAALAADGLAELQRSLAQGEPDVTS
jgi:hypothetical protein